MTNGVYAGIVLRYGVMLCARPAGPRTAEVILVPPNSSVDPVTSDTGVLATASVRKRIAKNFVEAMVAAGLIPDLPSEATPWKDDQLTKAQEDAMAKGNPECAKEIHRKREEIKVRPPGCHYVLRELQDEIERALLGLAPRVDALRAGGSTGRTRARTLERVD